MQGGGGPAEPVLSKQSVLADDVTFNANGGEPAEATEWHPYLNPCDWTALDLSVAERHPQSDPGGNLTKESIVLCHREGVSPRRSRQKCSVFKWIATRSATARNDAGVRAGFLFDWLLKSHVKPMWMALSAFTMAARLSRFHNRLVGLRSAFTMAEILLSLTIIGVVAAITLPSLTGNINERTWNTQRKALYARLSQAISLMPALNGYGTLKEESSSGAGDAVDTVAETFLTAGLSKVLKINNICDNEHLPDCGLSSRITNLAASQIDLPLKLSDLNPLNIYVSQSWSATTSHGAGSRYYSMMDAKAAAFETANGESVVAYYNPSCAPSMSESKGIYAAAKICVSFLYDLNGNKGPNTVGKDLGLITVYYPSDSLVVAPVPYSRDAGVLVSDSGVNSICKSLDEDYRLPTIEELGALSFNSELIGNLDAERYASSTFLSSSKKWYLHADSGILNVDDRFSTTSDIRCVKR